jgi:hypothetical protein
VPPAEGAVLKITIEAVWRRGDSVPLSSAGVLAGAGSLWSIFLDRDDAGLAGRHDCGATVSGRSAGRTTSAMVALNLPGSSTNGSWPECSNHTSFFTGVVKASK